MRRRLASATATAMAATIVLAAVGGATASVSAQSYTVITLRHPQTGFTIRAPEGFKLQLRSGVYVLRKGATTMSFSRLATGVTPAQLGGALFRALGGRVLVRAGDRRHVVGQVANGRRGDTFVVERVGSRLAITTSTSSTGRPVALETLRQIGLGARGGVSLRAPKAKPQSVDSAPLLPRARRRARRALVPAGNMGSPEHRGRDQGLQPEQGGVPVRLLAQHPAVVSRADAGEHRRRALPDAVQALIQVLPRVTSARDIRVRRVLVDGALPSFTSSGMIQFDYRSTASRGPVSPRSAPTIPRSTATSSGTSTTAGSACPSGSSSAVGVGLLRSWKSWDPSGAIAARTRASIALINETNADLAGDERVPVPDRRSAVTGRRLPPPGLLHRRGQRAPLRSAAAALRADLHRTVGASRARTVRILAPWPRRGSTIPAPASHLPATAGSSSTCGMPSGGRRRPSARDADSRARNTRFRRSA